MSNTSLYPPIVASSMPAFDVSKGEVKVYFQISKYNSIDQIGSIQVSIRRRDNNTNMLVKDYSEAAQYSKESKYGHKVFEKDQQGYFVRINNGMLKSNFKANTVYKVQLRFSASNWVKEESNKYYYSYLLQQTSQFSEWSSVCLIKPINTPTIGIVDIDDYGEWEDQTHTKKNYHLKIQENKNANFYYNNLADFIFIYDENHYSQSGKNVNIYDEKYKNTGKTKILKSGQSLKQWKAELYKSQKTVNGIFKDTLVAEKGWVNVVNLTYQKIEDGGALQIPCSLPYQFQHDAVYRIDFKVKTTNDYLGECSYYFIAKLDMINHWVNGVQDIPQTQRQDWDGIAYGKDSKLTTFINQEQGYIKVVFNEGYNQKIRNLILRRATSKTDFKEWEDIRIFGILETINEQNYIPGQNLSPSFTYYDFTVESGIAYRYIVQERDQRGRRYTPLYDQFGRAQIDYSQQNKHEYDRSRQYGMIGQWEHAFLLQTQGHGLINQVKQLKLKYNFSLSSLAVNVVESKTDTLGSQYPFIKRNASTYYRSFPISGTIAASMDNAKLFTSRDTLNNEYSHIYDEFKGNINTGFSKQYDYTYERKFRQAVMEFLYDSKPKLFKTMQQGNILIRLMEISLSPVEGLNRLIYNFTATAYEIGQTDIESLEKWGIINTGIYDNRKTFNKLIFGQLYYPDDINFYFKRQKHIIGVMSNYEKYQNNNINDISIANQIGYDRSGEYSGQNYKISAFNIKWLRITFESDPYLIKKEGDQYYPVDDEEAKQLMNISANDPFYTMYRQGYYLGHLIRVFYANKTSQGHDFIISPPNNIFEIREQDGVTLDAQHFEIKPKKDCNMLVDYIVEAAIQPIVNKPISKIRTSKKIGQFVGHYNNNTNFIESLYKKYGGNEDNNRKIFYNNDGSVKAQEWLQRVNYISIDADPNVVVQVETKEKIDKDQSIYSYMIINETGQLQLRPSTIEDNIINLRFKGIYVDQSEVELDPNRPDQCIYKGRIEHYDGGKEERRLEDGDIDLYNRMYEGKRYKYIRKEISPNNSIIILTAQEKFSEDSDEKVFNLISINTIIFYNIITRREYR